MPAKGDALHVGARAHRADSGAQPEPGRDAARHRRRRRGDRRRRGGRGHPRHAGRRASTSGASTTSLRDLGRKALAVNLSDLAAMGAEPVAAIVGLGLPPAELSGDDIDALYAGMDDLAARHGVTVAGGDVTGCPSLALAVTAIGRAVAGRRAGHALGGPPGRPALRHRGASGAAAAGLLLLEDRGLLPRTSPSGTALIAAQTRPEPRLAAGPAPGRARRPRDDGPLRRPGARRGTPRRRPAACGRASTWPRSPSRPGWRRSRRPSGPTPGSSRPRRGGLRAAGRDPPRAPSAACREGLGLPLTVVGRLDAGARGSTCATAPARSSRPSGLGWQHEL